MKLFSANLHNKEKGFFKNLYILFNVVKFLHTTRGIVIIFVDRPDMENGKQSVNITASGLTPKSIMRTLTTTLEGVVEHEERNRRNNETEALLRSLGNDSDDFLKNIKKGLSNE